MCHLSIGACSHRVAFQKRASRDGAWGPLGSGEWPGIGRYLLFPKNAPTYPLCLQYLRKAAYTSYAYPRLLCASQRSTACSSAAVLPLTYSRFLTIVLALNARIHPSSLSSLQTRVHQAAGSKSRRLLRWQRAPHRYRNSARVWITSVGTAD